MGLSGEPKLRRTFADRWRKCQGGFQGRVSSDRVAGAHGGGIEIIERLLELAIELRTNRTMVERALALVIRDFCRQL